MQQWTNLKIRDKLYQRHTLDTIQGAIAKRGKLEYALMVLKRKRAL